MTVSDKYKLKEKFRIDCPETISVTDKEFDCFSYIEWLEKQLLTPEHETVTKWVNVSDRLPEEHKNFLVYDDVSERIGIREYSSSDFYSIDSDGEDGLNTDNITHWQPLPEEPK